MRQEGGFQTRPHKYHFSFLRPLRFLRLIFESAAFYFVTFVLFMVISLSCFADSFLPQQ